MSDARAGKFAVRLIVFDLDGTLVDSKDDLASSVNHALAAFGFPVLARETVYGYVGNGATALIRRSLPAGKEDALDAVLRAFLDHYGRHLLDTTVPYPGVRDALGRWGGAYPMAVLTNKPIGLTRDLLRGFSLEGYFADVRGGDSFGNKKPHPEGLLRIMEARAAPPGETLMVGDSVNDVLAGRAAGAVTCGVTYGLGAEGFRREAPDFTVASFPDLFARIVPAR